MLPSAYVLEYRRVPFCTLKYPIVRRRVLPSAYVFEYRRIEAQSSAAVRFARAYHPLPLTYHPLPLTYHPLPLPTPHLPLLYHRHALAVSAIEVPGVPQRTSEGLCTDYRVPQSTAGYRRVPYGT